MDDSYTGVTAGASCMEFQWKYFGSADYTANQNYEHIVYNNESYYETGSVFNVRDVVLSCDSTWCVIYHLAANYPILWKDWFSYDPDSAIALPDLGPPKAES